MPIEFRSVTFGPLLDFSATAPAGAVIGVIGERASGASEVLKLAEGSVQPAMGSIGAESVLALDHTLDYQDAVERLQTAVSLTRQRHSGSTILLTSHNEAFLESLCDEIWWLDRGRLKAKGDPKETLAAYRRHVAERIRDWGHEAPARLGPSFRQGDHRAEILSIETLGATGQLSSVWKSGEEVCVRVTVRFYDAVSDPVLGLLIRTQIGMEVYGTNTELERLKLGPLAAGDEVTVNFSFRCDLCPNMYSLTIASHDPDGTAHDWLDDAVLIGVTDERSTAGVANLRAMVTFTCLPARRSEPTQPA